MDPDVSRSITHHPHAFSLPSRAHSASPFAGSHRQGVNEQNANSTSVELDDGLDSSRNDGAVAFARHPANLNSADVESQVTIANGGQIPRHTSESDPYGLSLAYKTPSDLEQIKANTSRKLRSRRPTDSPAGGATRTSKTPHGGILSKCVPRPIQSDIQARRVEGFYEKQNATIERMLKSVEDHRADARQEAGEELLQFQIGVWGSFIANIILAILQAYAAISSGSLSLFTTMADSVFDPLSNLTLILSARAVRHVDPSRFPSGKARLETVGNIIFCFLMISVSLILIAFSARELSERMGSDDRNSFHLPSVIAVCVAFGTKFALFLYTWALRNRYSQIRILWQDHRNDLFVNGFGILTSIGGSKLIWWVDPMGAIILSVVISWLWLRTAFSEFLLLVGVVANVETQQLITYVCLTHSPLIQQIDTVRVYHSGPRLIAEVDIVMAAETSLQVLHDVAEDLQIKLESLPDVERAYVHVDYETTHKPEHGYNKDI